MALALSACTAQGPQNPSAGNTAEGTSSSDSSHANVTPTPTVSGELAFIAEPQLAQAMEDWAKTQQGSKVSTDAALRAQIPAAEKWLAGIKVVPSECGLYGLGNLKDQLDASIMTAVSLDEKIGADITVASYPDLNELVADVAAQQHLDQSCAKYTVTSGAQSITSTMSSLNVQASAPYVSGTLISTENDGKESKQISVRAIDGHIMVTATRKAAKDPSDAVKAATADVNAVLDVLREREAQATPTTQ